MHGVWTNLLFLLVFAGESPNPGVCEFMSVREPPKEAESFVGARMAQEKGDYSGALRMFRKRTRELSQRAEDLLFDGSFEGRAQGEIFLSTKLFAEDGPVVARRDVVTLRPNLWRWGIYLSCRSKELEAGRGFAQRLWRDYAASDADSHLVLLSVAVGKPASLKKLNPTPDGVCGLVAGGLAACVRGEGGRGQVLLRRVLNELKPDDGRRNILERWLTSCGSSVAPGGMNQ